MGLWTALGESVRYRKVPSLPTASPHASPAASPHPEESAFALFQLAFVSVPNIHRTYRHQDLFVRRKRT